jgi:hypothetical protein
MKLVLLALFVWVWELAQGCDETAMKEYLEEQLEA